MEGERLGVSARQGNSRLKEEELVEVGGEDHQMWSSESRGVFVLLLCATFCEEAPHLKPMGQHGEKKRRQLHLHEY